MDFREFLEANEDHLTPMTPDHVLTKVHKIIPVDRMRNIPYRGENTVTIYHGGSWPGASLDDIKPGDWVSLSEKYAKIHAGARGSKVISKTVPADHVSWAGTDENEWFYTPPSG